MYIGLIATKEEIRLHNLKHSLVVIIDVVTSSSLICHLLKQGVQKIYPVATEIEALELSKAFKKAVLIGEDNGRDIKNFNYNTSPLQFNDQELSGNSVILSTTNGAKAINMSQDADVLIIGCFNNLSKVAEYLTTSSCKRIYLVNSGSSGRISFEDFLCAGMLVNKITKFEPNCQLNDTARIAESFFDSVKDIDKALLDSNSSKAFLNTYQLQPDLEFCYARNINSFIPILRCEGYRYLSAL